MTCPSHHAGTRRTPASARKVRLTGMTGRGLGGDSTREEESHRAKNVVEVSREETAEKTRVDDEMLYC
jgi:hypothetical protein